LVFRQTEAGKGKQFVVKRKRFAVEQIVAVLKQAELGSDEKATGTTLQDVGE